MRKENAIDRISDAKKFLTELRAKIAQVKSKRVYRRGIRQLCQEVSKKWFEEIEPALIWFGISDNIKKKYHDLFTKLLKLSIKEASQKKTYSSAIDGILQNLDDELLVPVMKSTGQIISIGHLEKILESTTGEEKEYLSEALGCAGYEFFKASIVLGWCAAVHRMHKVIEKMGFDEFNKKSREMKDAIEGRFKRFKKSFNVHSLSELRATVFDNDLLWVLEYWGLIDSNQHDRLSICLTMRNNSAHPGEAPITEENLASFYSDIKNIIFDNPNFKL